MGQDDHRDGEQWPVRALIMEILGKGLLSNIDQGGGRGRGRRKESKFEIGYRVIRNDVSDFRGRGQAGNPESEIRKKMEKHLILMIFLQANHLGTVSGVHVPERGRSQKRELQSFMC